MYRRKIGNYFIKLQGTMITIEFKGQMIKAIDTNPLYSVERFNEMIAKLTNLQTTV
jgi:hypothetical protein